jgi:hypothetical protein
MGMLMKRRVAALYAFFCLLISSDLCFADEVSSEFHDIISKLYNFQPRTLSNEEINQKSAELDVVWKKVKSKPDIYSPLLRNELRQAKEGSFFLYDGSMLLMQVSESLEDKRLALESIARCDLIDIKKTDYLYNIHGFAVQGFNTTKAAFKILENKNFLASTPEKDLILPQNYSLIYMLIPTQEKYYLKKVISRLKSEKSKTAQMSLLLLLYYTATDAGDAAILEFKNNPDKPSLTRKYAQTLIEAGERAQKDTSPIKELLPEISAFASENMSTEELKNLRRKRMVQISKEALKECDQLTYLMRRNKKNPQSS